MKQFVPYIQPILEWILGWLPGSAIFLFGFLLAIVGAAVLILILVAAGGISDGILETAKPPVAAASDSEGAVGTEIRSEHQIAIEAWQPPSKVAPGLKIAFVVLAAIISAAYVANTLVAIFVTANDIITTENAEIARLYSAIKDAQSDAELVDLMADGRTEIIATIARHPLAGYESQTRIAEGDYSTESKQALAARREFLIPKVAAMLADHPKSEVRLKLASRNDVPSDLLTVMLYDKDLDVAVRAFQNQYTPRSEKCKIIQEILEGSDDYDHFLNVVGELVDYCRTISNTSEVDSKES